MDILSKNFFCIFAMVLVTSACDTRQVESSAERDARERLKRQTPTAQELMNNHWCTFVDSITNPTGNAPGFRGFLRLAFAADEVMTIETFNEADGKPFGKADDDRQSLWKLEGDVLHIRTSETDIKEFKLNFGEQKSIPVMDMKDEKTSNPLTTFWICNASVEDPIPVEIAPEVIDEPPPMEDFPEPPPDEPMDQGT